MRAVLAETSRRETHARFIAFHGCFPLLQTARRQREKERRRERALFRSAPRYRHINHRQGARDVILIFLVNFTRTCPTNVVSRRHEPKKRNKNRATYRLYINIYLIYRYVPVYAPMFIAVYKRRTSSEQSKCLFAKGCVTVDGICAKAIV